MNGTTTGNMRYPLILAMLVLIVIESCSNQSKVKKSLIQQTSIADYHKVDFVRFIDRQKNDSLDFYEELLGDKEFVNVLEHGEFYKNDVNKFLALGHFTYPQVAVCICAMQNLNVDDYVKLCNIVLILFNKNKVTEPLLQDAVDPDFLRKHIIVYNYNRPNVAALLKAIENNSKVTNKDFRDGLLNMLSGKSAKELHQFDDDNPSN